MESKVILVDEQDREVGTEFKMKAHEDGKLHRAFSIFVFNSRGELLLQQRSIKKYHSGGLWSNTCCSHPEPGQTVETAAHRRLKEEMGFDCDLKEVFSFMYKTPLDHGLTENEFDHVLIGQFDGEVKPNPDEADDIKWVDPESLASDIGHYPEKYTYWLRECYKSVMDTVKKFQ